VSHTDGFHTKLSVVQTSPLPILVSNNESGIALHVRAIVAIVHRAKLQKAVFFYTLNCCLIFNFGLTCALVLINLHG